MQYSAFCMPAWVQCSLRYWRSARSEFDPVSTPVGMALYNYTSSWYILLQWMFWKIETDVHISWIGLFTVVRGNCHILPWQIENYLFCIPVRTSETHTNNNWYNLVQQSIIFFVVWSLSNHFEFHDKESIELLSYDVTFAVFTAWNRINYVIGYLFCIVISITLLCQKLNISC